MPRSPQTGLKTQRTFMVTADTPEQATKVAIEQATNAFAAEGYEVVSARVTNVEECLGDADTR